jgi:hypothetical protein
MVWTQKIQIFDKMLLFGGIRQWATKIGRNRIFGIGNSAEYSVSAEVYNSGFGRSLDMIDTNNELWIIKRHSINMAWHACGGHTNDSTSHTIFSGKYLNASRKKPVTSMFNFHTICTIVPAKWVIEHYNYRCKKELKSM